MLLTTYSSYRALESPKPPYSIFASDNAPPNELWYANRLRLLQLLGGSGGTAYAYDVPTVLARIEPYEDLLIPEMIVLRGRQGRHVEAIQLLTHGLGDFDTAVSYCVLGGGAGIYSPSPTSGVISPTSPDATGLERMPSHEDQAVLFHTLLTSFLSISDSEVRHTQTIALLSRFAPWFQPLDVLSLVPQEWTVKDLEPFLESTVRKLVGERRETAVQRALVSVENLDIVGVLGEKISSMGSKIERVVVESSGGGT